jgi:HemY protein
MLRLVIFLAVSAVLAWAAVWVAEHPGTVTIQWLGRESTLHVGTALTLLLLLIAAAIVLFEFLRLFVNLPARWRISRRRQRELRGHQALTQGLMAAAAGDLRGARAQAQEAQRYLSSHAGLLLLDAQAAQMEGREEVAHLKFRQMLERRDGEFVGLRGLLGQTMKAGDFDEALELARRAYRRSPTTPWVLTTLFDLLTRAEKWDEALSLVGEMQTQKILDEGEARRKRAILHHLIATRLKQQDRNADALNLARKAVKASPSFAPAAVLAAELAMSQGRRRLALQILEDCWRAEPHPDVGHAYAQLDPSEAPAQRLQRVDARLAPLHRDHVETLALQAELAMQAEQWDVARSRLDAALRSSEPTARVYRLLAELERSQHGNNARAQEWLSRATDARPDKAWICDDTGEILAAWQPFGTSGRFDAVHWTIPPRVATLVGSDQSSGYIVPPDATVTTVEATAEPEQPARPTKPETGSGTVQAAAAS